MGEGVGFVLIGVGYPSLLNETLLVQRFFHIESGNR